MHKYSHDSDIQMTGKNTKKHVAIVGARGYAGMELCRILMAHPSVAKVTALGTDVAPDMSSLIVEWDLLKKANITININANITSSNNHEAKVEVEELRLSDWMQQTLQTQQKIDAVFLATPAEASFDLVPKLFEISKSVIDLSGALRLDEEGSKKWYGLDYAHTNLLSVAKYGLSPWVSMEDSQKLISNPGCYATSILMGLLPLLTDGQNLIQTETLVIDAKSGTSGAGKKAAENLLFTEVEGDCLPYRIGKHQHLPEVKKVIKDLTGVAIDPFLSTSLLPVRRGITTAIYAKLQNTNLNDLGAEELIQAAYQKVYANYPLVSFGSHKDSASSLRLQLKKVVGTARTHITFAVVDSKLYVYVTIDNLLKGAASQAVENFNQIIGLPITTGLSILKGTL